MHQPVRLTKMLKKVSGGAEKRRGGVEVSPGADRDLIPESDKLTCDRNKGRQRGSGSAEVPLCPQAPLSSPSLAPY